jgi:hypothetical protein
MSRARAGSSATSARNAFMALKRKWGWSWALSASSCASRAATSLRRRRISASRERRKYTTPAYTASHRTITTIQLRVVTSRIAGVLPARV